MLNIFQQSIYQMIMVCKFEAFYEIAITIHNVLL